MPSLPTLITSNPLVIRATQTDSAFSSATSLAYDNSDDNYFDGFYSEKTQIIKWGVFLGVLVAIAIFFSVAYWHAKRRMKKGLEPMAYHRFLVRRQYNARWGPQPQFAPQYVPNDGYYGAHNYNMNAYPPAPPMYNANYIQPPQYEPSKNGEGAPQTNVNSAPGSTQNQNQSPFADQYAPSSSQQESGVTAPGEVHTESRRWRFGRK